MSQNIKNVDGVKWEYQPDQACWTNDKGQWCCNPDGCTCKQCPSLQESKNCILKWKEPGRITETSPHFYTLSEVMSMVKFNNAHNNLMRVYWAEFAEDNSQVFFAWQCMDCGRYHSKKFPDEGCETCKGSEISKRLGLEKK